VRVAVDRVPVKRRRDIEAAVSARDSDLTWSSLGGVWISAGQVYPFVTATPGEQGRALFEQRLIGKHFVAVTICYCSVLDECWVTGWRDDGDYHDDGDECPIKDAERFRD
jgi:hypothetical protein